MEVFSRLTGEIYTVTKETTYCYAFAGDKKACRRKERYIPLTPDTIAYKDFIVEEEKLLEPIRQKIKELDKQLSELKLDKFAEANMLFCLSCHFEKEKCKCKKLT